MNQTTKQQNEPQIMTQAVDKVKIINLAKWVLLTLSILFIGYIYQQTLNPLTKHRAQIMQDVHNINELQNRIINILNLSHKLQIQNFDNLNELSKSLQTTLIKLSETAGIKNTPELYAQVQTLLQKSRQQESSLKSIKDFHTIIQNSYLYLPSAFNKCINNLNQQNNHDKLSKQIKLVQKALIQALTSNQKTAEQYFHDLKRVNSKLIEGGLQPYCNSLIKHNQVLANYELIAENIHTKFLNIGLKQAIHQFDIKIEKHTSEVLSNNNRYYIILSLLALFLIMYIGFTLKSLFKTNTVLSNTLSELSEQQGLFTTLIKC